MRVYQITCPHCGSGLKSKDGIPEGKTIPCPKCKKKFAVRAADEDEVVEDFDTDEPAPKKGPRDRRAVDDDLTEEDEAAPRKARRRRDDDDDTEEQPRPKKKKRRRVEEDQEQGLYARLKGNILVRVITLVVLFTILAVLAYLLYEKKKAEQNAAAPGPRLAHVAGPPG
jgi:hypothetical protein